MNKMFKPVHPGRIIRDDYLEPLELTTKALAEALGVTRQTMTAILNERAGVSPEMALRLAKAFDTTPGGLPCKGTMIFIKHLKVLMRIKLSLNYIQVLYKRCVF